jgi:hypothetical protein
VTKKNGDQQPEPDRVELGLESLDLPAPQHQPDDQARGERAEDHVQPEIGSDHHKREQQQHGEAHRELAAGVQVPLDERPVTTHRAGSQPGRDDGHEDERRQQQRLTDGVGRRTQEQRHDQHRAELANRAGAQDEGAQPRLELAGIPQHRHQRPERRSGHRGADEQAGEDHPGCRKRYGKAVSEDEREQPAEQRESQRRARDPMKLDLVAGKEEQEAEAELIEKVQDLATLGQPEHVGADQRAEQDLRHGDRNHQPGASAARDVSRDRCGRGGRQYDQERRRVRHRCLAPSPSPVRSPIEASACSGDPARARSSRSAQLGVRQTSRTVPPRSHACDPSRSRAASSRRSTSSASSAWTAVVGSLTAARAPGSPCRR